MGKAYECDKCTEFFPGVPFSRYLPRPKAATSNEYREIQLELCKICADEFDTSMLELSRLFRSGKDKRKGSQSDTANEYEHQQQQQQT